jgi:hypothetical protein
MLLAIAQVGGWSAIALGIIALLRLAVWAVVEVRKVSAPVELVQAKGEVSRAKDASGQFTRMAALAETQLAEKERAILAEREAHERTRQRAEQERAALHDRVASEAHQAEMYLAQNEGLLVRAELAEKDAAEHRDCRELVRSQDGKISAQAVEIAVLSTKVDACEERHEYADKMIEWLTSQVGPRASEPPPVRPRSITPTETPRADVKLT